MSLSNNNPHRTARWFIAAFVVGAMTQLPLRAAEPSGLAATSYGAAGEISGSLHILDTGNGRWMIDCGAVIDDEQASDAPGSGKSPAPEKDVPQTLPLGAEKVSAVILTHAHADHLGRLPLLVDRRFHGPIYTTEATAALAVPALRVLLLYDRTTSRHWSWSKDWEMRAEKTRASVYVHWRNCSYRRQIAARGLEQATCSAGELFDRFAEKRLRASLCPKCLDQQVAAVLQRVKPLKYGVAKMVAPGVSMTLLDAGHIPGAASVVFDVTLGSKRRRVVFSGDLGNGLSPLLAAPRPAPTADAVFVECTYGPIRRKPAVVEQRAMFRRAVADAVAGGGVTWIPCFAMDRTQKILYELHVAQREKLLPERLPIYCPSPTAKKITELYRAHRRDWFTPVVADEAGAFSPGELRTTVPAERRLPRPCIIISTGDILLAQWMAQLARPLAARAIDTLFLCRLSTSRRPGSSASRRRNVAGSPRAIGPGPGAGPAIPMLLRTRRRRRDRRVAGQCP